MQRIAIVGGGYAGLGTAVRLSKVAQSIHMYDHFPPGAADASATSAGIMHPMATRGKFIWKGREGLQKSLNLMQSVQTISSGCLYDDRVRLNRLLFTKADVDLWTNAVTNNPDDLELVGVPDILSGNSEALGAVRIKRAVIVDSPAYLKALWAKTVQNCPVSEWKQQKVQSVADLSQQYDAVVLACGGGIMKLCAHLNLPVESKIDKIRLVRGQNAVYEGSSSGRDDVMNGYLSGEYCIPYKSGAGIDAAHAAGSGKVYMLGGSTHEHITPLQYEALTTGDKSPSLAVLQEQLQSRLDRIYPPLQQGYTPVHTVAGTKVVTNRGELGRLPIVGKLQVHSSGGSSSNGIGTGTTAAQVLNNVWVHTGLGSRGLILHALTSEYLSSAIVNDDESLIPQCLHPMTGQ